MMNKTKVENIADELSQHIMGLLEKDPYLLLREADLTGHLWIKINELKDSFQPFSVKGGGVTSPLHLEYPRHFFNKNGHQEIKGRSDIVILKETNEAPYNAGYFDYQKVGVAFEVKCSWNGTPDSVIKNIMSDIVVFNSEGNQDIPEYGISFNVNTTKAKDSFSDIRNEINQIKIDEKYEWAKTLVIYIESYDPKRCDKNPQLLSKWLN